MIEVKAKAFVGVKFSNLCRIEYDEDGKPYEIEFLYERLEDKVKNSFDDDEIHPSEVTPELVSLLLDLDYTLIQNSHDAYIGECIQEIDIGTNNENVCDLGMITTAFRKVENHITDYVADDYKWLINFVLTGKVHMPSENKEIEE